MTRLKIALVCDWFVPQIGGIENHLADLARELRARGHDPHVITSTPGPSELDGVPVHRLPGPRVPAWRVVGDPRTLARVRALCARERFDVIHGHSLQSPLAHVAMYVARELGTPSVMTQHTMLAARPSAVLRALDRAVGWSTWPTVMTAVSSAAAERTRLAMVRDDLDVLHTGLDLAGWTRRRAPRPGPTSVVCVTRLYGHKHPDELLHAIPRVLASCRDPGDVRFTIVGDGPQRRMLERLAHRLGIADHTTFVGALPRRTVAALVEDAHVFVVPNFDEAFGIVALEARALGVPVIARSASGTRDVVTHGQHGLLCASIDDMARAIALLCDDHVLRAAIAKRACEGLEAFSWPRAVDRHLAIYQRAARPSGHRELRPRRDASPLDFPLVVEEPGGRSVIG